MPREKTNIPPLHFTIPSNLDFAALESDVEGRPEGYKRDIAALILTYVLRARWEKKCEPNEYVHLKADYLIANLHRQVCQYLRWLITAGVLEIKAHKLHKKSTGYRFAKKYRNQTITLVRCTDLTTYKKYKKIAATVERGRAREQFGIPAERLRELVARLPSSPNYEWLIPRIQAENAHDRRLADSASDSLLILGHAGDGGEAINDLHYCTARTEHGEQTDLIGTLSRHLHSVTLRDGWRCYIEERYRRNEWSVNQRNIALEQMQRIEDRDFYCRRNQTNQRLDTNITNLSRSLRTFLRLDGRDDLAMLDIRSSQPYLLAGLARFAFADGFNAGLTDRAIEEWARLVTTQDIYQLIANLLPTAEYPGQTRQDGKDALIKSLFNRNSEGNSAKDAFALRFPEIFDFTCRLRKWEHSEFSVLLQQIEAAIVIDGAVAEVAEENIPLLTIHDSIIIPAAFVVRAREALTRHLTGFVGVPPVLHEKTLRCA